MIKFQFFLKISNKLHLNENWRIPYNQLFKCNENKVV